MKKILSLLLCLFILFSFVCVPVQAAEINGFYSYDMTHSAFTFENVDNVLEQVDYTDRLTVTKSTYLGSSSTNLTLPIDTNANIRYVSSFHIENLNSTHEYNLKFKTSSNSLFDANSTVLGVYLIFYNGDTILKEQDLVGVKYEELGWQNVDIDFKPDAQGLGGYKTRIEFRFLTTSKSTVTFRLSEIIEFTDKDDNASWFEKIINAIKELPSNFVNGVKGFFDNLGDKFESVGNSITNKFEEVKNAIGQWFTDIGDRLSAKFQEVGNAITSKFQEIGNEFSERFEKFKPRIYEQFNWTYGYYDGYDYEFLPKEDDFGYAVITEPFVVPQGTTYKMSFSDSGLFTWDISYNYSYYFQCFEVSSNSLVFDMSTDELLMYDYEFTLNPGNVYVFVLYTNNGVPFVEVFPNASLNDVCNSLLKVYADEGWLSAMVQSILSGLKTLFLPSGEFFENKLEELRVFFDEKFGLFALPFTLFVRLVSLYNDVGVGSGVLHLKDFNIFGTNFLSSQEINLKELISNFSNKVYLDSGVDIYEIYFAFIDVIILFAFVRLIKNKYEKMLGTGAFSMPKDIMQEKKGLGEVNDN